MLRRVSHGDNWVEDHHGTLLLSDTGFDASWITICNLQHPENYNRNTIPKHKRQMFDRRSIVAHWYPRAVPLRSWAIFLDVAHFNIISQALAMSTPSAAPTMKFLFCVFLLLIIEIYTDDWGGAGSEVGGGLWTSKRSFKPFYHLDKRWSFGFYLPI